MKIKNYIKEFMKDNDLGIRELFKIKGLNYAEYFFDDKYDLFVCYDYSNRVLKNIHSASVDTLISLFKGKYKILKANTR